MIRFHRPALALALLLVAAGTGVAEDDLLARSLPYRTALHHDPSLGPPLERLLALYQEVDRVADLAGLYRRHLQDYPADARAWAVLVRLLTASGDLDARSTLEQALAHCPDDGYLRFLQAQAAHRRGEAEAREHLAQAVATASDQERRRTWARELVSWCAEAGDEAGLAAAVTGWRSHPGPVTDSLRLARLLLDHRRPLVAGRVVADLTAGDAEEGVELELVRAECERLAGDAEAAGARLDALLGRLEPGYWRRDEVLRRRLGLVDDATARMALIDDRRAAAAARPLDEAAWLDLARVQHAFDRRHEALATLRQAAERLPASSAIETALREQFRHVDDLTGLAAWLGERIAHNPGRLDLLREQIEALYLLERFAEAQAGFQTLVERLPPAEAQAQRLALARELRPLGLVAPARDLLEAAFAAEPDRLDLLREILELDHQEAPGRVVARLQAWSPPAGVAVEAAVDLARWLLAKGFVLDAKAVLEPQLARSPHHPDINVLLAQAYRRLGLGEVRRARLERLRSDARTVADYRRWLETLIDGQAEENLGSLLWPELERLAGEADLAPGRRLERELAVVALLAEVGDQGELLVAWLEAAVARAPADHRPAYRLPLIAALERGRSPLSVLQPHLLALADEVPEQEQAALARLLVIQSRSFAGADHEAPILDPTWLARVRPEAIDDLELLAGLRAALANGDHLELLVRVLQRQLALEPADLALWEGWLTTLLTLGQEERFRTEARRLLANHHRVTLPADRRQQLRRAVVASLWRSLARAEAGTGPDPVAGLELLTQAEALITKADRSWILYARAHLHHRLGDHQAVTSLLDQLAGSEADEIVFPDGLRLGLDHARCLLAVAPAPAPAVAPVTTAPTLAWRVPVTGGVLELAVLTGAVVVRDRSGVVAFDRATGKRRWAVPAPVDDELAAILLADLRQLLAAGPDRVLLVEPGRVTSRASDGTIAWRAETAAAMATAAIGDGVVVLVEDGGRAVSCRDLATGKLRWRHGASAVTPLPAAVTARGTWTTGFVHNRYLQAEPAPAPRVAVGGGLVLVVGAGQGRLHDLRDGTVAWDFASNQEPDLPVELARRPAARAVGWSQDHVEQRNYHHDHWFQTGVRAVLVGEVQSWFEADDLDVALFAGWLLGSISGQARLVSLRFPVAARATDGGRPVAGSRWPLVHDGDWLTRLDTGRRIACPAERVLDRGHTLLAADRTGFTVYDTTTLEAIDRGLWPEALATALGEAPQGPDRRAGFEQLLRDYRRYSQWAVHNSGYQHYAGQLRQQLLAMGWDASAPGGLRLAGDSGGAIAVAHGSDLWFLLPGNDDG